MLKVGVLNVIILLGLFASCRKEIEVAFPPPALVHVDPVSDSLVLTCDSLTFFWPTYYPVPAGDTNIYWFDLDSDGSLDLKAVARNYPQFYSTQTTQYNYQANIEFSSPDSSIEFAWYSNYTVLTLLDSMDVIHVASLPNWRNNGFAMFHHTNYPFGQSTATVDYIAYRRIVGVNQYKYGWIRFKNIGAYPGFLYAITDWGWNNTVNQAIGAGQY
jgi:hypothetical protein